MKEMNFVLWMLYAHVAVPLMTLGVYHIGQGFGFLPTAISFTPEATAQMIEEYDAQRAKESMANAKRLEKLAQQEARRAR